MWNEKLSISIKINRYDFYINTSFIIIVTVTNTPTRRVIANVFLANSRGDTLS